MRQDDPPPNHVWCSYVPSRHPNYKYYNKSGPAKASIMLSTGNGIVRGGTVFEYKDGKWEVYYQFYPNKICTVCEQPITMLYSAVETTPKGTKTTEKRWRHNLTYEKVICEPPAQQRLELE
jgi:hypothetical protein